MMMFLVLVTLFLLAISITLSETKLFRKRAFERISIKNLQKPPSYKPNYSNGQQNNQGKNFMDDSFFLSKYLNTVFNKSNENSYFKESKKKVNLKKQNTNSIINWFKN